MEQRSTPEKVYGGGNGVDYETAVVYEQGGKRYAVVSSYKGLHGVDVETGTVSWLYDWEDIYTTIDMQATDPLVIDNKLFIVGCEYEHYGGMLMDISSEEPKVLWVNKDMFS